MSKVKKVISCPHIESVLILVSLRDTFFFGARNDLFDLIENT